MRNSIKQKIIIYLLFLFILTIFTAIYSLLIFKNKVNVDEKAFNTHTFIIGVVTFLILGVFCGNTAQKNGLLEGLIAATFIILISLFINLFTNISFISKNFIKIFTYLIAASAGGILGVNFKPLLIFKTKNCNLHK